MQNIQVLGIQVSELVLILVFEGVVFHYIWLKCLFWDSYYTFWHFILTFCLKMHNWEWKKKADPNFLIILGRSEKGKQTFFLGLIAGTSCINLSINTVTNKTKKKQTNKNKQTTKQNKKMKINKQQQQ